MDLNEAFNSVKELAEKSDELRKQKEQATKELQERINKNYQEVVYPEMQRLLEMLKVTRKLGTKTPGDVYLHFTPLYEGGVEACDAYIRFNYDVPGICGTCFYTAGIHSVCTECHDIGAANALSSLDKCAELVKALRAVTAAYLEKCIPGFKELNEGLETSITALTALLKSSSVVEENEDGTVEIQLGGKTYIGHVKEA